MEYTITEVKGFSEQTYGKYNSHRTIVRFEGQDKDYSAFVKEKPSVGDVWNGELKKVEKDDKIYYNFEFAKKSTAPVVDGEVGKILGRIQTELTSMKLVLLNIDANTRPKSNKPHYPTPEEQGIDLDEDPFAGVEDMA